MTTSGRSTRHQRILRLFDATSGRGLEIGPLFDPVVRRSDGDVRYVDVHSGDDLKRYYSSHPGVPVDDIVDPDFVLIGPEGARTLPDAVKTGCPFNWVVASHVIEHVPDVIGWLDEVASVLVDDGVLILAIPDRRFSFDALRTPTTVGEMLLANASGDKKPSVRAIYDHYSQAATVDAADVWRGALPGPQARIHPLEFVREQIRVSVEGDQYVDCHVWLFTPASFVQQLADLAALNHMSFSVEALLPTAHNELEFYAVLRRMPRRFNAEERSHRFNSGITIWTDNLVPARTDDLNGARPPTPPTQDVATPHLELSVREQHLIQTKRSAMRWIRHTHALLRARNRIARRRS